MKAIRSFFSRTGDALLGIYVAFGTLAASVASASGESTGTEGKAWQLFEMKGDGKDWQEYVNAGLSATQGIALIFLVFCGFKLFAAWASGSEDGGRDKGALIKWAIGLFIVVAYFALAAWIKSSLLGTAE